MNRIIFERLFWKNWHSFLEGELIITPGKHLIIGENLSSKTEDSNGAGKSGPLETLPHTVVDYSRQKDPSKDNQGNCMTGVEFRKNGIRYKIEKYVKDEKFGNGIQLYEDDENLSHRKNFPTKAERDRIVEFSQDSFISTVVVMQGLPVNFTQLTPTIRKSIVESILGFSIWNSFRPRFTGRLREITLEKNRLTSEHTSKRESMIGLNTKLETLKKASQDNKDLLLQQLEELTGQMNQVQGKLLKAQQYRDSFGTRLTDLNEYIDGLRHSLTIMKNKGEGLKSIVDTRICSQCEQPFPEAKINAALDELHFFQTKISKINDLLTEAGEKKSKLDFAETQLMTCNQENRILESKLGHIKSLASAQEVKEDLGKIEESLDQLVSEVNGLLEQLQQVDQRVSNIEYLDKLLLPSSKFRSRVLEKYLGFINSIVGEITPMILDNVKARLVIDSKATGIEIELSRNGRSREYASFSGGEQRKLDIIFILAFQKFILENSGLSTNLLVLDEIFDGLDSKGISSFLNSLDSLFPDATSVYVITHNNNVKSLFNSVIKVVKENDVSKIILNAS